MKIVFVDEKILQNYYPLVPFRVEACKDLLRIFDIKPSARNGLTLCYILEEGFSETKNEKSNDLLSIPIKRLTFVKLKCLRQTGCESCDEIINRLIDKKVGQK